MNVSFCCPECHTTIRESFDGSTASLACGRCGTHVNVTDHAVEGDQVVKCLVCPSHELFVRKDFPQRLGVGIVVLAIVLSSVAWYYHMILLTYAILFLMAIIDVALYVTMGDVLECYRCHAQYRSVGNLEEHRSFDLEVHEKHRQQKARLDAAERR